MKRSKTNKIVCASICSIYFLRKNNQAKLLKINELIFRLGGDIKNAVKGDGEKHINGEAMV